MKPLKINFYKSLSTGELPREWIEANITPIFRKGSRVRKSNYRPISLTSVVCKLIESIVRDHIMKFLNIQNLINSAQQGFVPIKACLTNLLETLDTITDALNKGSCVDLIFFDFARAFDKVSHPKLIQKLEAYAIDKVLVRLIKTFLTDRKQRVMTGDNYSEWEYIME